jgi:PAS domain S-box-containing protein
MNYGEHGMRWNMTRLLCLLGSCLMLMAASGESVTPGELKAGKAEEKRVLILYTYNFNQPAQQQISAGLETARRIANLNTDDFIYEYLDISPPKNPEQRLMLRHLLIKKYAGQQFDLIITIFDDALNFLLNEGKELSPGSPCLALYAQERPHLERAGKTVFQSPLAFDVRGTLELALKLFPQTHKVLFVSGKGHLDKVFENKARVDFAPWQKKLEFEYSGDISVKNLLEHVKSLSPGTVVIYSRISSDITGKTYQPIDIAIRLAETSNAPVFCLATSQIGTGVVGGSMVDVEALSTMLGRILPSLMSEKPLPLEPASHFLKPMVNWQQIRRWGVSASHVPDNALIINRPPTLWSQYKVTAIIAMAVFFVLTIFIIALVLQNYRRRIAEKSALESEARYRILIEQAPDAIVVYDSDLQRFVDANASAERLFGCNRNELLQSTPQRFYQAEQPDGLNIDESVTEYTLRALAGEELQFDRVVHSADGRNLFCEVRLVRLPFENRNLTRASFIDITDRKQAEKEKMKLQDQLKTAQKMEAVGRLAGGVAHDFNNMLSVILGHTELALVEIDSSNALHASLEEIHKAAKRSTDLTRQLLAFARKQTVQPRVLGLNMTVEGMLKMLGRLIGEDIELVWRPGSELWTVKIDPSQIDQLLANLCINARDAVTGVGRITIETGNKVFDEVSCSEYPDCIPGEYVMLAVSDNGSGMDKDTLEHIFEPFFTTKGLGQGTGLGLATVYGIIKQNEGFINVYSEPGNGSIFNIYLRRCKEEDLDQALESTENLPLGHGETVLMVEDDIAALNIGKVMLEHLGYTVLSADTPEAALSLAKIHAAQIALLITDVIMPEMNGRELAKLITDIKPGLKCLFCSGYTADVISHRGMLEKGVQFLQKPYSVKDLAIKVRQVMK